MTIVRGWLARTNPRVLMADAPETDAPVARNDERPGARERRDRRSPRASAAATTTTRRSTARASSCDHDDEGGR